MGRTKSPPTIGLPLPRSLESMKLEDVQRHFELYFRALNDMYRNLMSDITTIEISSGPGGTTWLYFGSQDVDGSWRIGIDGTDLNKERRESGVWVPKAADIP